MRGELDWIVMRCLEKDRVRRYETVSALARDVERYLHDEAVEACPPSAGYRLRKFARKNRVVLTTAAAFVALLVLGAGISAWLAVRANLAADFADEKRVVADKAQHEASDERDRADKEAVQVKASAAETLRALDRMTVAKGIQLADEGNVFGALPWFVRPLERGGLTPEEEKVHRTRIACYLKQTPGRPTLRQMLFCDGPVTHAEWSADAKRVLTVSNEIVQVWDVRSGESIATLGHPAVVTSAQFTPDGKRVLTVAGSAVWAWDAQRPIDGPTAPGLGSLAARSILVIAAVTLGRLERPRRSPIYPFSTEQCGNQPRWPPRIDATRATFAASGSRESKADLAMAL